MNLGFVSGYAANRDSFCYSVLVEAEKQMNMFEAYILTSVVVPLQIRMTSPACFANPFLQTPHASNTPPLGTLGNDVNRAGNRVAGLAGWARLGWFELGSVLDWSGLAGLAGLG